MLIGHNKIRSIKSKVDSEDYYVVSSNLSFDYFNTFAYKCPVICNIVEDATVEDGVLQGKIRQMYFRDNAYVEAGSRFSEMPIKVPYGAREYHDAILEGIKASIDKDSTTKETASATSKLGSKKQTPKKPARTLKVAIAEVVEKAKEVQSAGVHQNDIMDVMKTVGYPNPNSIPDIETADNIIGLLDALLEG